MGSCLEGSARPDRDNARWEPSPGDLEVKLYGAANRAAAPGSAAEQPGSPGPPNRLLVSVVQVAVEGKDIVPEVTRGVAPYRVRVVRAALGVVPLDEEVRALQPVVTGLAWL
jgi:hypothetical protein